MKFSIIIPIHNAEKYLESTINSVLSQSFTDYELILINDGSSDNSINICNEFISDKRIIIYDNNNHGVSYTRNFGINKSSGDYILFLDADDMLGNNALNTIYQYIHSKNPDILFANYCEFKQNSSMREIQFPFDSQIMSSNNYGSILKHLFCTRPPLGWAVWKQCYKSSVIKENNIYFDEQIILNEDGDWLIQVILSSKSFCCINKSIYNYRIDNYESVINQRSSYKKYSSSTYIYSKWFKYFINLYANTNNSGYLSMASRMAEGYVNISSNIWSMEKTDRKKSIVLLRQNKDLLKSSLRLEHRLLYLLYKIFGAYVYLFIGYYARNIKNILFVRRLI